MTTRSFFQDEQKFIIGQKYETLNVDDKTNLGNIQEYLNRPKGTTDEYGIIRKNSIKFVGTYIKSICEGYRDNSTRHDFFQLNNTEIIITLDYNGSTRYREFINDE